MTTSSNIPVPRNEPILSYAPGSAERAALKAELKRLGGMVTEIPVIVNGQEVRSPRTVKVVSPHRHAHHLADTHQADARAVAAAIAAAKRAQREWASWKFEDRAAVLLKAADLLAGSWRQTLNAATMLGQSKTVFQAELDSAVSPFNFTAIGANLPTAPALMGNTVVWKPAATAALSNYFVMRLLEEAGLPPGVINFIPGDSQMISERVLADRGLAGIHFTGSTGVFQTLWKGVASRLENYASYPRLVGETGGKDFILAHPSADAGALAVAMVRGAFEYQGQKCSAASRAYIPQSLWPTVKKQVLEMIAGLRMGISWAPSSMRSPSPRSRGIWTGPGRIAAPPSWRAAARTTRRDGSSSPR